MVRITGKSTKLSRSQIRELVDFFLDNFFTDDERREINITINFVDAVDSETVFDIVDNRKKPTRFNLNIKNYRSKTNQVKGLFHELTHVKQFYKREMRLYSTGKHANMINWKGHPHPNDEAVGFRGKDYWLSPWEIEAAGVETNAWELWKEINKKKRKVS